MVQFAREQVIKILYYIIIHMKYTYIYKYTYCMLLTI